MYGMDQVGKAGHVDENALEYLLFHREDIVPSAKKYAFSLS
jgi:hypothetical protein